MSKRSPAVPATEAGRMPDRVAVAAVRVSGVGLRSCATAATEVAGMAIVPVGAAAAPESSNRRLQERADAVLAAAATRLPAGAVASQVRSQSRAANVVGRVGIGTRNKGGGVAPFVRTVKRKRGPRQ